MLGSGPGGWSVPLLKTIQTKTATIERLHLAYRPKIVSVVTECIIWMHGTCWAGKVHLSSVTSARFILFTGSCPRTCVKHTSTTTSARTSTPAMEITIMPIILPLSPFFCVMLAWESASCFPGTLVNWLPARFCSEGTGDGGQPLTALLQERQRAPMSFRIQGISPTIAPLWAPPPPVGRVPDTWQALNLSTHPCGNPSPSTLFTYWLVPSLFPSSDGSFLQLPLCATSVSLFPLFQASNTV